MARQIAGRLFTYVLAHSTRGLVAQKASGLDFYQLAWRDLPGLGRTPVVDVGDLVHAGDGAVRGTALFRQVFPLEVGLGVLCQRDSWVSALL